MSDSHNHERIKVLYFVNRAGYVIIAPDQRHPCPSGFEPRYATNLREVDSLTRTLNRQDTDMFSRLMEKDRKAIEHKHAQIRAKLGQRLLAVDCSRIEALFIRRMFAYLDKKEAELRKCEVRGYFHQREYDSPGRDPVEVHGRQLEATQPKMSSRLADILTS